MNGWRQTTLGETIILQRGHDLTEEQRTPGPVPVIGSAGQNGWHNVAKAEGPGVTVGRSGASVGVVTYVRDAYWPHNTALYVRDFKGNDPLFVASLLRTLPLAELNSGSAQPSLNRNFLYPIPVSVPAVPEQRRIASILGAYDDLIEINRRRIALLESMARSLFYEWFVRFRFPGHEGVAMADTPEGPLPIGWERLSANRVLEFDPKTKVSPEGEKPFVSMGQLDTMTSVIAKHEWRQGNSGAKFRTGDVLFARITPCLENGKTGLVRTLPGGVGFGSTEFIVIRAARAGSSFAYCLARSDQFRANAIKGMSGASGRQRARTDVVSAFTIAAPSGSEIFNRFEDATAPMLNAVGRYADANAVLTASRDLLLPRLLSGQLSVATAERELLNAA